MCDRLDYSDKDADPERIRQSFDSKLGVRDWVVPGRERIRADVPDNAPDWWHGEEEASASFLTSMGVALD